MPTYPAAWRTAWRPDARSGPSPPAAEEAHRVTTNSGRYEACETDGCGNQVLRDGPHTRCKVHRGPLSNRVNYIHISICHDGKLVE